MLHDAIRVTIHNPDPPINCDNYDYRKDPNNRPPSPSESTSPKNEQQSLWNRVMQVVGRGGRSGKGGGPPNSKGPGGKQNSSPLSELIGTRGSSYRVQLDSNAQSPQASQARDQFLLSLVQCFARELPGQVVSSNLQVTKIPQRKCPPTTILRTFTNAISTLLQSSAPSAARHPAASSQQGTLSCS